MMAAMLLWAVASGAAAEPELAFRVLTYNIHHGEGTDGRIDIERIAGIIRETRADVVCLQEVDRGVGRSGRIDIDAKLAERLGMELAYGPNLRLDGGHYGNATLTRFPIVAQENIPLPTPEGQEPRGCLRTTLEIGAHRVDVYNMHFGLTSAQRKEQASALAARLGEGPAVVAGDLNARPGGPVLRILAGKLRDTFLEAEARGSTEAPGEFGDHRIDYVLVSRHIDVLSSRVVSAPPADVASDHLPYAADLSLSAPSRGAEARGIYDADDERVDEAVGE